MNDSPVFKKKDTLGQGKEKSQSKNAKLINRLEWTLEKKIP